MKKQLQEYLYICMLKVTDIFYHGNIKEKMLNDEYNIFVFNNITISIRKTTNEYIEFNINYHEDKLVINNSIKIKRIIRPIYSQGTSLYITLRDVSYKIMTILEHYDSDIAFRNSCITRYRKDDDLHYYYMSGANKSFDCNFDFDFNMIYKESHIY